MGVVRPIMIALVAANVVNVVVNWILIYGHLGAPALGVRGSAWATVLRAIVMAALLLVRHRRSASAAAGRDCSRRRCDRRRRGCAGWLRSGLPAASADHARGRRLRRRDRAGRAPAARGARGAPDCASTSPRSRSWCRSAWRRRGRCGSARRSAGAIRQAAARAGWTALLFGVGSWRAPRAVVPARPAARSSARSPPIAAVIGDRRVAADRRRGLPAVRRRAGGRDRRAARPRRYAHADVLEPRGPLVRRAAARLRALLRRRARRRRPVVGAVDRPDHLRRRAACRMVEAD